VWVARRTMQFAGRTVAPGASLDEVRAMSNQKRSALISAGLVEWRDDPPAPIAARSVEAHRGPSDGKDATLRADRQERAAHAQPQHERHATPRAP
jgi:hypothetical protein